MVGSPTGGTIGRRFSERLLVLALTLWSAPASAQVSEHELKAVFLFNFASFIGWPRERFAGDEAPITIGVIGDPAFLAILERTIAGERVEGRPLVARALDREEELDAFDVVFISATEREDTPSILERARGRSILTVGEIENFASTGGVIGFRLEQNRIRFQINLAAAADAKLEISSQLLKLADIVNADGQQVRRR